jgi:hypothetical protein
VSTDAGAPDPARDSGSSGTRTSEVTSSSTSTWTGLATSVDLDATTPDAKPADATALEAEAAPAPCAGLQLCDDFESTATGQPPSPTRWLLTNPGCSGRGTVTVDSTHAHSGSHAVKVVNDFMTGGPPAYCDHVFFTATSPFTSNSPQEVYARFFVYLDRAEGMGHVTFASMTDHNNGNNQLRVGFNSGVFIWDRQPPDAYLPELDTGNGAINTPVSQAPTSQTWMCVELHLDEAAGTVDTWIDDTEVPGLAETGMPVPNISTVWLAAPNAMWKPQITDFSLGWETYVNNASDAMTVWFDAHRLHALKRRPSGSNRGFPSAGPTYSCLRRTAMMPSSWPSRRALARMSTATVSMSSGSVGSTRNSTLAASSATMFCASRRAKSTSVG